MNRLLTITSFIISISCNAQSSNGSSSIYKDWKTAKDNFIEFKYPQGWYYKYKPFSVGAKFELTDDSTISPFVPFEIWRMNKPDGSFDEFSKHMPPEYFIEETDGKPAKLISTSHFKFHNFQAVKTEFSKSSMDVDIITVNAINKYYMIVRYRNKMVDSTIDSVMNSIVFK